MPRLASSDDEEPPGRKKAKLAKRERDDETGDQTQRERKRQKVEKKEEVLKVRAGSVKHHLICVQEESSDNDVEFVPPRDDSKKPAKCELKDATRAESPIKRNGRKASKKVHFIATVPLRRAEEEKRAKYGAQCDERGALFVPLAVTTYGGWSTTAVNFFERLVGAKADELSKPHGQVRHAFYSRLAVALARCTANAILDRRPPLPVPPSQ